MALAAGEKLAAPARKPRVHPWVWVAAFVLHVLVIALLLLQWRGRPQEDAQSPPGISVVFDNGGATQATAPQTQLKGPPQTAETPPPPPPPPPAPAEPQVEESLNVPLSTLQNMPQAQQETPPRPKPAPVHHARPAPQQQQRYVMMDGMSYGTPSPLTQPRQTLHGKNMNLSLPETDAQAVTGHDFTVHGDVGADWDAALTKWVEDHAYYPQAALEQNQQGTAEVEFTVDRSGHVTGLRLKRSAGSNFLDLAWEQLFADNQLPPFPPGAKDDHAVVDYTVHYQIVP